MNIILKIENLSKQYRLGLVGTGTLGHDLNRFWYRIRGKEDPYLQLGNVNDRSKEAAGDYVWALRDIDFEVEKGEVLGIIGKNGAGKSTLLKLLSRVTSPTTGEVKSNGRIASLLEVGTGFHPELTGRENIYLNGAILGMTKKEIASKIDDIIEFSGCQMYIDTPAKRYSSGMTVRLAFAVAAHLEPEILVIDEVLAVGDAEFQKKAVGKMQDISKGQGRTVLFVSHNMSAVKSLCTRAIVLDKGRITFSGDTAAAVDFYLKLDSEQSITNYKQFPDKEEYKCSDLAITSIGIKNTKKQYDEPIGLDEEIEVNIEFDKFNSEDRIDTTIQIKNGGGEYLLTSGTGMNDDITNENRKGKIVHKVIFQPHFFSSEEFYVNLLFVKGRKDVVLKLDDVVSFLVIDGQREIGTWMGKSLAPLKIKLDWSN